MKTLVWGSSFKKAFKRIVRKNPQLEKRIFEILDLLVFDPFAPFLKSHKLSGQLQGLWACSVAYDCRIIYTFKPDENLETQIIVLVDIGTHDDVY